MVRELNEEQRAFVAMMITPEFRAEMARNQAAHAEATAKAQAIAEIRRAEQLAKEKAEDEAQAEAERPLREALKAAGIKLEFEGYYDGAWFRYQIGDGPVVELETGLNTFKEQK